MHTDVMRTQMRALTEVRLKTHMCSLKYMHTYIHTHEVCLHTENGQMHAHPHAHMQTDFVMEFAGFRQGGIKYGQSPAEGESLGNC